MYRFATRLHPVITMFGPGLLLLVSACNRSAAPTGQVVARVNGSDVTSSEIQAEMVAAQLPGGVDAKAIAPQVLQSVVTRKIVAIEARRTGFDKTPDYLALTQRANEVILGQQLINRWTRELPQTSDADIAAEVAANPQRYDRRETIALDQLALRSKLGDPTKLTPLHSMAEIIAYLDRAHVAYQRGRRVIDSADLSAVAFQQLSAAPPGEPLVELHPDGAVISVVTAREASPLMGAAQRDAAIDALKRKAIKAKIAQLESGSSVQYQPGYAPRGAAAAASR